MTDFERIEKAIQYLIENRQSQPGLEELADVVHLSPFHFQRLFERWCGISPKKFLQYLTVEYAKKTLKESGATLTNVAESSGLSGTGRLYDHFVNIESMTPGEFANGARNLQIAYNEYESPFGKLLIASTEKGVCLLSFMGAVPRKAPKNGENHRMIPLEFLRQHFPNAHFTKAEYEFHQPILQVFDKGGANPASIRLHLKGTPFQLKVWQALLQIPEGEVSTYGAIAENIGNKGASRAVGTAVGQNPVAIIIPCHRVIRSSGVIGEYYWGTARKAGILGWEAAVSEKNR